MGICVNAIAAGLIESEALMAILATLRKKFQNASLVPSGIRQLSIYRSWYG